MKIPSRSAPALFAGLIGCVALGLTACKRGGSDPAPPQQQARPATARAELLAQGARFAKPPADAVFFTVARAPSELLTLLGYAEARAAVGPPWEEVAAEALKELGFDPTDPRILLKRFGADPDHPVGLVIFNHPELRAALWMRLADPAQLSAGLAAFFKAMGSSIPEEPLHGGRAWIDPRGEVALFVKGEVAWFILQDRRRAYGLRAAVNDLGQVTGGGLADTADFKQATADLGSGRDLAAYLNVTTLVGRFVAEITGSAHTERLRQELADLEARGEAPEEAAELRADLQRREGQGLKRAAQGAAVTLAVQTFAGGLSAARLGIDLDPDGVRAEAGLRITETSLPHRLLDPGQGAAWLFQQTVTDPLLAGTARLDLPGIEGVIRQIATFAGGGDFLSRLEREAEQALSLTSAGLLATFDGRAEWLIHSEHPQGDGAPSAAYRRDFEQHFAVRIALGVKDPARAKTLLDAIVAAAGSPDARGPDAEGRWVLPLAESLSLTFEVKDGWLTLSNRGAKTAPGGFPLLKTPAAEVLGADLASRQLVNWPEMARLALRKDAAWSEDYYADREDPRAVEQRRHQAAQHPLYHQVFALFGGLAVGSRLSPDRLDLQGIQVLTQPPRVVVARLAEIIRAVEAEDRRHWEARYPREGAEEPEPFPAVPAEIVAPPEDDDGKE